MRTELYWIPVSSPGRIAIMPRPRGGDWLDDEVRAWRAAGVDVVVSLLEADECTELDLSAEEELARANRIEFVAFPIPDRGIPKSREAVVGLATKLVSTLKDGKNVAIHCRQGIGRAALVAIAVLILLGVDLSTAIDRIGAARGLAVPETPEQRDWLQEFARSYSQRIPA